MPMRPVSTTTNAPWRHAPKLTSFGFFLTAIDVIALSGNNTTTPIGLTGINSGTSSTPNWALSGTLTRGQLNAAIWRSKQRYGLIYVNVPPMFDQTNALGPRGGFF
jgi:hypothetical protein